MPRHLTFVALVSLVACEGNGNGSDLPDPDKAGAFSPAAPILPQEPIPYPPALFASGVEGEVMLYLVIDANGAVIHDSTRIVTSSGHNEFDAAALQAAPTMRFTPAHRGDTAVQSPIQVPVHFTRPDSLSPTGKP